MLTLLLALGSALHRAVLHQLGAPPVRTYYGFDTRADGLLLGCAAGLCVSWRMVRLSSFKPLLAPSFILIVVCMFATDYASPFMHLGGFTLLAGATAVLILNVIGSPSNYSRSLLEYGPLVWIGRISYGLYLWHYVVFKATSFVPLSWPLQLCVAVAATFAVTSLSFYLVEQPALSLRRKALTRVVQRSEFSL
jgi:peptidoglycan/LPS O-acetylase OafA/YrhL